MKLVVLDYSNYSVNIHNIDAKSILNFQKFDKLSLLSNIYNNYENVPIDMFTIDLKNTYETLGEIIGATYKDDLLDELFSKFCLGK